MLTCDTAGDEATAALINALPDATGFTAGDNAYEKREKLWIGKELYCPPRMDRPYELSAIALLAELEAQGNI